MIWRLIEDGAGSGPWNMGVDEALLRTAEAGTPSLRFYSWSGPWLSLGYGQTFEDPMRRACEEAGAGWVKRTTGGRALLHGGDLTYAIAAPFEALPGTLGEVYGRIGAALLQALCALGIPASVAGADAAAPGREVFDCFSQPAGHEIVLRGGKLVGSAQRRTRRALLQHGSIRRVADPLRLRRALGLDGPGATELSAWGEVGEALLRDELRKAFAAVLGAVFEAGRLEVQERRWAARRGPVPDPGRSSA